MTFAISSNVALRTSRGHSTPGSPFLRPVLLLALWIAVSAGPGVAEEAGELPGGDLACPEEAKVHRSDGWASDHQEQAWVRCRARDEEGLPILHGPEMTYAVVRRDGEVSYRRIELQEYLRGTRHGVHRRWAESGEPVLEETFVDGQLHGESRSWFLTGAPREVRHYRKGRLHGERRSWYAGGEERWKAVYEDGEVLSVSGDRSVAGEPCPEGTLPAASADGREEFCDRGHDFAYRHGPYVVWGPDGSVVERGLYRSGKKHEIWEAPPDAPPSPHELADLLVAEAWLRVGELDLASVTETEPHFWFRSLDSHQFVNPQAALEGSRMTIAGLPPGSYGLYLRIDADPSNPEYYPGDLGGDARFEVETGAVTRFEVDLDRILHLAAPFDNGSTIYSVELPCDEKPLLPAPVRFAWKAPVPPVAGVEYRYQVQRVACDPYRSLGMAAEGSTRDTAVEISLPPSRPGEAYSFRLQALRGEETVGFITSHGPRSTQGWDVRFRVGPG